ncbi:CIS tube protein [Motilibacter deserti]|uniref:LysM peptidoglycan-binding domain-containing protein n=1 Tax=Motilibacter deserti TaxID=2714956 RepID=A0ABX0GVZ2_9ACTN|nr:LysM peptidoglycan-binding domain-containing protein [Motilibacter deserti]NHC13805.1 LysM peptidoglycan-binding domain-containing protein [Motilibacter deserti]
MVTHAQENLLKATLTLQQPGKDGGIRDIDTFSFPFNPKEWSITHAADWKVETTKADAPPPEFKGPKPASATVEIFLDESEKPNGDISTSVERLKKAVAPEPGTVTLNHPVAPYVLFEWGKAIRFLGYVESIAVTYTMFRGGGAPIRGSCKVTMKEFPSNAANQNPTSGGEPGYRTRRVVAGDTLASIAYEEYGSPAQWRALARANRIVDPSRVPSGVMLQIPPPNWERP